MRKICNADLDSIDGFLTLIRLMDFLISLISGFVPSRRLVPMAFLVVILLAGSALSYGQTQDPRADLSNVALAKADSLFAARQYTQAFELYTAIRQQGSWSTAMLLKMAYIQEGLGRLGESMYYLNLYALASHDPQASKKMEELAEKFRLEGYQEEPMAVVTTALREYYVLLGASLAALAVFILALMGDQYHRNRKPSRILAGTLILLLATLFAHVQFSRETDRVIVTRSNTYLMTGPSGGASVVEIIGEGHQLRIISKQDVWLKVEWKEKEVYVRDFLVRTVQL